MNRIYQWTEDDDEIALDAVTVNIGSDAPVLERAGKGAFVLHANVYWPPATLKGTTIGRSEGPFEVDVALDYAEEMAKLYGFPRVVISILYRDLWEDGWGMLADKPGL